MGLESSNTRSNSFNKRVIGLDDFIKEGTKENPLVGSLELYRHPDHIFTKFEVKDIVFKDEVAFTSTLEKLKKRIMLKSTGLVDMEDFFVNEETSFCLRIYSINLIYVENERTLNDELEKRLLFHPKNKSQLVRNVTLILFRDYLKKRRKF